MECVEGARMESCVWLPVHSTVMSTGNHMLEPYSQNFRSARTHTWPKHKIL